MSTGHGELERFARLYRGSEFARSGDHSSDPNDARQSLETVALAMARLAGAVPENTEPPDVTLPIFWHDAANAELEHMERRARSVMRLLLCFVRFYEAPEAKRPNKTRWRRIRAAARARHAWWLSRWETDGIPPHWRMEREALMWRLASLGLTPREALAQLFEHRHAIARWKCARLAYLRAALHAQQRILAEARLGTIELWGVHVSGVADFAETPGRIPIGYLMQEVEVYAKANRIGPAVTRVQPWLTSADDNQYRECFMLRPDADRMRYSVQSFMSREYWSAGSAIYWVEHRQGREFAAGTTLLDVEVESRIDGRPTSDPTGALWSACKRGAVEILGRPYGRGELVKIQAAELEHARLTDFNERPCVRNLDGGVFWTDPHVDRAALLRVFVSPVWSEPPTSLDASIPDPDDEKAAADYHELLKKAKAWVAEQPPQEKLIWKRLADHLSRGGRNIGERQRKPTWERLKARLKTLYPDRWHTGGRPKSQKHPPR